MEENTSNLSTSPYMFRPILEPSTPLTDESLTRSYYSHTSLHTSSTPHLADRLSVMDRNCSSRIRVSSGGSVNPLDVSNVGNFRPQPMSSPTVSSGCVDGITKDKRAFQELQELAEDNQLHQGASKAYT